MKFSVSSKVMLAHLSAVSKVVSGKTNIAILSNFLFVVKDGKLVVTGTDKESTIVANVPVEDVEGELSFAISVKKLLDLFKEMPEQGVTFEVDEQTFETSIRCLNGEFKFAGLDGAEFPEREAHEDELFTMTIPAAEIPKSLEKTIFAAGTDPMRPVMMGILWDIKEDGIVFVSSDTHKLARYINHSVKPEIEGSFILPVKIAAVLTSVLEKQEEDVVVSFDSKSVMFEAGDYLLECRFINGKYPNYNAVIPKNNPYEITVDKNALLNVVKRVSIFATDGGLIQMNISNNQLLLKATDPEMLSNAEERLACEYQGDNLSIGFHKDRLIEVLNSFNVDNIVIKISDPARPGLFLPVEQKNDENWVVLVMPMMIPNV